MRERQEAQKVLQVAATYLIQVTAPHFVAGATVTNGRIVRAAPIIRYMVGWELARARDYALCKRWRTRRKRIETPQIQHSANPMKECKRNAIIFYFDKPHEAEDHGAGAMYADEEAAAGRAGYIYLHLPAENVNGWDTSGGLHIRPMGTPAPAQSAQPCYPSWEFTGDITKPETFTLAPSIHLPGVWHGWLRDGQLISC